MIIPKEIVEKMEKADSLMEEINIWMQENGIEADNYDCNFGSNRSYGLTDKPDGVEQNNGVYCDQFQSIGDDCFYGIYYYPTEKGNYFYVVYGY